MPGASAYFLGGAVVYTRQARRALLAIPDEAMAGIRSASEPYAALLARTVRERHGATWGLAETGATGPTGNRYGDPAGHACIAVSGPAERVLTLRTGSAERQANMETFGQGPGDPAGGHRLEIERRQITPSRASFSASAAL